MHRHLQLALLLVASSSTAASPIGGVGNITCGQYMQGMQPDPQAGEMLVVSWTQGLLSGINARKFAQAQTPDAAGAVSIPAPETISAYIKKECAEYPLDVLFEVAVRLNVDLEKHQAP